MERALSNIVDDYVRFIYLPQGELLRRLDTDEKRCSYCKYAQIKMIVIAPRSRRPPWHLEEL